MDVNRQGYLIRGECSILHGQDQLVSGQRVEGLINVKAQREAACNGFRSIPCLSSVSIGEGIGGCPSCLSKVTADPANSVLRATMRNVRELRVTADVCFSSVPDAIC